MDDLHEEIGVAYWHQLEDEQILPCACGAALSACGSACSIHDDWRVSGRVVGGNSLGVIHRLTRNSTYCYVVTSMPASLGTCPGDDRRGHVPVAVFGRVPLLISDNKQIAKFLGGGKNQRAYVDFSDVNRPRILLEDNNILVSWKYYLPTFRYLGTANFDQSVVHSFQTGAGEWVSSFDGVEGAICLIVDNHDPSSHKSVLILVVAVILGSLSLLVAVGFLYFQQNVWQAFSLYVASVVFCFTLHLLINGLLEVRKFLNTLTCFIP